MELFRNVVSPLQEMKSWETLWGMQDATQKRIAEVFKDESIHLPSVALEHVKKQEMFLDDLEHKVAEFLSKLKDAFSVCVRGTFHYPTRMQEAKYPVELFYYRGDIGLLESKCISIVGARKCSDEGKNRARRLARELVGEDYTVVSGLAAGIDTAAMTSAVEQGGNTVGVIGTPINHAYPKENAGLQEDVAARHLLVSHVPFYRYANDFWKNRRYYFPQRNAVMASLSSATVIVEASETSGTHTQARSCMQQGRKLFILNSCFESGLKWPHSYEERGAIRVRDTDDILRSLKEQQDDRDAVEKD